MSNRSADTVFQLVQSLRKEEKRHFKLYIGRNSGTEGMKIVQLFDALERMEDYDEAALLKRLPQVQKRQLPNLKAHLYRELLAALRLLKSGGHIDLQLHEQLDFARILYDKGLYLQSLKILEKAKETARQWNQDSFLIQMISMEKKIETLHITRSMQDRADTLTAEAEAVHLRRRHITRLSNLALQLYSWYLQHGHARGPEDEAELEAYFRQRLPADLPAEPGFYAELYLYQSWAWYAYIRQDFLQYYRYTGRWVRLFSRSAEMQAVEPAHYIKGLHNLLNAHFTLRNGRGFAEALAGLEAFCATDIVQRHDNSRILCATYLGLARLNRHFMEGTFTEGLSLVGEIEALIQTYGPLLDPHRIMVFYYKIASLLFGSGDYGGAVDYLNKIIHWKVDLRTDLQCYARILHLLAHYELGNATLLEPLTRSVFRFMARMKSLTPIEEEVFLFLRRSMHLRPHEMTSEFRRLLARIRLLERDRFARRSFAYLDLSSWLEGKLTGAPLGKVIQEKGPRSKP